MTEDVMQLKTILIIEDDRDINEMLQRLLKDNGYEVRSAYSGTEGLLVHGDDDLIILDLMLPGKNGEEIIGELKKIKNVPIIVTSAISDMDKKLNLFELGADDYVVKPFNNDELLARIRVHLKRRDEVLDEVVRAGDVLLNKKTYTGLVRDIDLGLSRIEFDILCLLVQNCNQVVTKSTIFETVWDNGDSADENSLNVHISKIRNKLKKVCPDKDYIETIWSIGYKFKV